MEGNTAPMVGEREAPLPIPDSAQEPAAEATARKRRNAAELFTGAEENLEKAIQEFNRRRVAAGISDGFIAEVAMRPIHISAGNSALAGTQAQTETKQAETNAAQADAGPADPTPAADQGDAGGKGGPAPPQIPHHVLHAILSRATPFGESMQTSCCGGGGRGWNGLQPLDRIERTRVMVNGVIDEMQVLKSLVNTIAVASEAHKHDATGAAVVSVADMLEAARKNGGSEDRDSSFF